MLVQVETSRRKRKRKRKLTLTDKEKGKRTYGEIKRKGNTKTSTYGECKAPRVAYGPPDSCELWPIKPAEGVARVVVSGAGNIKSVSIIPRQVHGLRRVH